MKEITTLPPAGMWAAVLLGGLALWPAKLASAAPLRIDRVEKAPVIDGVPGEWQRELGKLTSHVKGAAAAPDLAAKAAIAYDDKTIFVSVDVTDDVLVGGGDGDRVDLVIAVGSQAQTVSLFPGQPGKSAGKATSKGQAITGAKVVEAPRKGGWTLEASLPWTAFDGTSTTRVGMRGGLFVHDVDAGSSVDASVGSASSAAVDALPSLLTTPEQSLTDGLIKDKKLGAPSFTVTANVAGDAMKERVMVFDNKFLVVLGSSFRGGKEYYFSDMAVSGFTMTVKSSEARDLDGDGRDDLVFKKRFTKSGSKTTRDVLQVLSFGAADVPELVFRHEIGISNAKGSVSNDVSFGTDGGKPTIVFKPGTAKGLDDKSYDEPTEVSFDALLLPWGTIESQTYKAKGKGFTKASEKTRAKPASEAIASAPTKKASETIPAATQPPKVDSGKVYNQFKKDRGAQGSAKIDLTGDVAEDGQVERVVLHDKDLAVFGPGFKGGNAYVFTTLAFASASDIKSVTLKDVTGDKKAELIVRGVLKSKGPNKEDVEREVELVFRVTSEGVRRIFGAEVGRSLGAKRIIGDIKYDSSKSSFQVVLASGKAVGFTKESYPFNQDRSAVGGFEPLLLPWGDPTSLRYKWSGSVFEKQ